VQTLATITQEKQTMASTVAGSITNGQESVTKTHIVVVNDTQEILELFREILEEEGYKVSLYSFAFNDINEIVKLDPDLVILDLMIGGESVGWQLLQKMKMDRRTAKLPIVVCTAALQLMQEIEGHLRAKGVGVILKPFDIDELVQQVQDLLISDSDAVLNPVAEPARTPASQSRE
jgi:DNA-binding response OmpR family regulator